MMNIVNPDMVITSSNRDLRAMLANMDLQTLKQLRKELDLALASYEDRRRREALHAAEQAVREHGFKLGELLGDTRPGKTGKSPVVKYVNPDNPAQTWGGRGRHPDWLRTALQAGHSIDDLRP